MTEIVYNVNGLTIDVYYDRITHGIKWSIQSSSNVTPTFSAVHIEALIFHLQKSLDSNREKQK